MPSTRARKRPTVDIRLWPGLAVCSALQLALSSDELPGIGDDFASLRTRISPSLSEDIAIFQLTTMPSVLTDLGYDTPIRNRSPEEFFAWVEGLAAEDLAARARAYAAHHETHEELHALKTTLVDSPEAWTWADATLRQLERARQLMDSPAELQAVIARTLRQFWASGFREVYQSHMPAMERIAEALRTCPDLNDLSRLFRNLLGRSIEDISPMLEKAAKVALVPFPFMGPYIMSMTMEEPEEVLLLGFDAQTAWETFNQTDAGPELAKLKALADETRLRILAFVSGGERFGRDIVTHLGISQPGVSRHLRLLTASGLLRVRQEGTSKFYSICNDELDALAAGIQRMKSAETDEEKGATG